MTQQKFVILGALAALSMPGFAGAQNPQPGHLAPPNSPSGGSQTLSDKLSQQRGTLQPPAIDPGIHKPLPQRGEGNMPVIPPPGTPGGNQQVVPK